MDFTNYITLPLNAPLSYIYSLIWFLDLDADQIQVEMFGKNIP